MADLAHETLQRTRRTHPAWRLLTADHAPLVLGFCAAAFLEPNVRRLPGPEAADLLEDYLSVVRSGDPEAYPKRAEAYLSDWSRPEVGWLRRFYPPGADVPWFEPTSALESAARFARELGPREFVGTASRLLTIRDLLRQITAGAAPDRETRLAALQRQRAEIDAAIEAIHAGTDVTMDDAAVRERHAQVVDTAHALLSDLRAVEERMRELDRSVRATITSWDGPRGELLEAVFNSRQSISSSDQGRTWSAFWEFLLSSRAQDELDDLLGQARALPALAGATSEAEALLRTELFHAAETTQRTVASLSAQLRRFLDDSSWAEARRIAELLRETLTAALAVVETGTDLRECGAELPDLCADITLPLERPLYVPRLEGELEPAAAAAGDAGDVDVDDLLDVTGVDVERLQGIVEREVAELGPRSLGQVVTAHPLDEGLAELIGYLEVSDTAGRVTSGRERIGWTDAEGRARLADLPLIVFSAEDAPVLTPWSSDKEEER